MFKPTAETAIGADKKLRSAFVGKAIPFATPTTSEKACTKALMDAGQCACTLYTDGKASPYTANSVLDTSEVLGFVVYVYDPDPTTATNGQYVPDVVGVMCHSGCVAACKYDTAQAPALHDRVQITSTNGHYGEVRISAKIDSTQIQSEGEWMGRNVVVIQLDTDNTEALCLIL